MERAVFDQMAEVDGIHWWYVARREILKKVIEREVRLMPSARILEIGCGTGHNLAMLSEFGSLEATELDDKARALATKRLGRPAHNAALPELTSELAPGFDLIALLDVLEHVEDDAGALAGILRLLRPGGALLLTVPINKWMWTAHDVANHHHRRYTRAEIVKLAADAGYEAQLVTPFNTLLFPLIAAARLFGKVTGKVAADDALPHATLNHLFKSIFALEKHLIGRVPTPFGVSLVAVLRRPES